MENSGNKKELIFKIFIVFIFILIISMPKLAFSGTLNGLKLWVNSVLPGLFVAMIISTCVLRVFPFTPEFAYIYIIVAGIFCGYPVGAILCAQYHSKERNENLCEKLIAYCNISSPSFVVNYIMLMNFSKNLNSMFILGCIYLPVIISNLVIILFNRKKILVAMQEVCEISTINSRDTFADIVDDAVWKAIRNSLKLGGYIILFACLSEYIENLPYLSFEVKTIFCGITEITNGISMCDKLAWEPHYKLLLALSINAFGGISTIMQTSGMIKDSGLSIKKYAYHKLIFTLITVINTLLMICVKNIILR